jgi:hypothetical protein
MNNRKLNILAVVLGVGVAATIYGVGLWWEDKTAAAKITNNDFAENKVMPSGIDSSKRIF